MPKLTQNEGFHTQHDQETDQKISEKSEKNNNAQTTLTNSAGKTNPVKSIKPADDTTRCSE